MRCFMNVCDGHAVAEDPEGSEYSDLDDAREAAMEAAHVLLAEGDAKGECRRHWRVDVIGPGQEALFSLPFMHALHPGVLKLGAARC